jgi:hypothetical protein
MATQKVHWRITQLQYLLQKYSQFLGANFGESPECELRLIGLLRSSWVADARKK